MVLVPRARAPDEVMAPEVMRPVLREVENRLVELAVVANELVVVAFVEVELRAVKFCKVEDAKERNPPVRVESPVTDRVPKTERLVGEKLVALRLVAKKFVVVALVPVALTKVKFCKVVEPLSNKLESEVKPPVAVRVPVKLAAEEIV